MKSFTSCTPYAIVYGESFRFYFYEIYEAWSKNNLYFKFYQIVFIYLSIFIYLVPFQVDLLRYDTLMPEFFPILETLLKRAFWYRQQLLFRFFNLNRSKTLSFYRCLQFWKEEKVSGDQVRWLRRFCFCPKTYAQAWMCELVRYHSAKSMIGFCTILCVSDELLLAIGA